MNKITQTARYRQSLIHYAQKNGVTAAAIRYRTYRQYIYRWMKRYDGTLQSLEDRSHRPHSHPNQHRTDEIKLIDDMRRRNPNAAIAADYTVKCIENTIGDPDHWYGVKFEPVLPYYIERLK